MDEDRKIKVSQNHGFYGLDDFTDFIINGMKIWVEKNLCHPRNQINP